MKLNVKTIITSNTVLKVISCILGYTFWSVLSASHTNTIQLNVPVCFYGQNAMHDIKAPDTVTITLSGKRSDLSALDPKAVAMHVDATQLHQGTNQMIVDNKTLFLPDTLKLVNYCPSNIVIDVQEKKTQA